MEPQSGYYRHPTIHGDQVVFVCEDDLWTVPVTGGFARRLTASTGRVSFPVLSPDGAWVAYTSQDEGPNEVWVMDAEGGAPRRLTWLGHLTQTVGWRPDSKAIVFASDWRQIRRGLQHLAEVPVQGGPPRALEVGPARAVSYEPSGKGVVLGRNSGDPARWKRYRGGTAGTIWIDREGHGSFAPLLELEGNLASPMWVGDRIWFLSDHEGYGNLYSCSPQGGDVRRHTDHEDYYVRFPCTDGARIVYHAGADLFVYDPAVDRAAPISIRIASPRSSRSRRFVDAARYLDSFHLHPKGHSAAVVSRGGAFTMGLWDGPVTRHGEVSRERRRLAAWLADGSRLVSVSDAPGEEVLVVEDAAGGPSKEVAKDVGRPLELVPSPAAPHRVALSNHRQELWVVDVDKKTKKKVAESGYDRIQGMAWSPDGRWLAYAVPVSYRATSLRLLDADTGKTVVVTGSDFLDVRPAFDPEGRYLYFLSWRVFDPVYDSHYFDLGFPRGARPYLVLLRADDASPFDAAQRDPRAPFDAPPEPPGSVTKAAPGAKGAKGKAKAKAKSSAAVEVRIDVAGLENRIVALPVPEGRYTKVAGAPGRVLMSQVPVEGTLDRPWPDPAEPPSKATLEAYDLKREKRETVASGISDFEVTADGKTLGLRVGNRLRVVGGGATAEELGAKEKERGRASGWVDLLRLRAEVIPGLEWRQMLREAWRLQRDHFWTPDMSGISWTSIYDRYLPLVDRVGTRAELSDLVWEMQGELGTSHAYEIGGDYRAAPPWYQGFLGADLEYRARTKSWHVVRIPHGDVWDERQSSPLSAPGLDVREGDRLVAIDGREVGKDVSPYERLVHRAGQAVRLTLERGAGKGRGKARSVNVVAAPDETALRYRDWVEANRAWVHAKGKGKVGYVHIPDMGPNGYSEFHRYYRIEVERDGLIVDVRFNGGGHVSQILIEKLLRRRIGYDKARWQKVPISYPDAAPKGPMVALINEYAGSDGDIFSHAFKAYGLGPLVGKRTWGGVIGVWPRHALVDGSVTTQPEFSSWFADIGWGIENRGVPPDVEVDIRPQDYRAGKDPQLERGLTEALARVKASKPLVPDFADRPNLRPPRLSGPKRTRR